MAQGVTLAARQCAAGVSDRPARRLGPRPLALHLAQARRAWGGIDGAADAVQLAAFLEGLRAYWAHPYRRVGDEPPVLWSRGSTRLLDYGPRGARPLLAVPSLINRAYVLDLAPGRSLMRHLAGQGLRPLLLDWGAPDAAERRMTLSDHIVDRLEPALDRARALGPGRPILLGYCMGGLLALAAAARRPDAIEGLILLATPWDFHAGGPIVAGIGAWAGAASAAAGSLGGLPVELIQTLFAAIDPLQVPHKFARFAAVEPGSIAAETFVAVEDWLNDGVPLGAEVARECLSGWYVENRPARGVWHVAGAPVRPQALTVPSLVAIPDRDRIVPPASAAGLADALPDATTVRLPGGHIGMVVGGKAGRALRAALGGWLPRVAAMQK
jgi:polyhydroxyalkanoate synthase subunit PhaC